MICIFRNRNKKLHSLRWVVAFAIISDYSLIGAYSPFLIFVYTSNGLSYSVGDDHISG